LLHRFERVGFLRNTGLVPAYLRAACCTTIAKDKTMGQLTQTSTASPPLGIRARTGLALVAASAAFAGVATVAALRFTAAPEARPAPSAAVATAATPASDEENRQRHLAAHQQALLEHGREPVNPSWARAVGDAIKVALSSIAEQGQFSVLDVDCRSHTCVGAVRWSTASAAYQKWNILLTPAYPGCGVEVMLDKPQDPAQPLETRVLFLCARS
jgi:hypothetical protein